jgi:hypothetical protein
MIKFFFLFNVLIFSIQHAGGEFLRVERTYAANPSISSQITPRSDTANGITAVVWNDNADGNYQVAYSLFNATTMDNIDADFVGPQRQTNNPVVAALGDRLVIVYSEDDIFLSVVYEVRFTIIQHSDQMAIAQDIKVLSTAADMRYPGVAILATGHFIVSWEHNPQLLDLLGVLVLLNEFDVRVRAFNPDGSPASNSYAVTNNKISFKPSIAALDDGRFVSTWYYNGRIYARLLAFTDGAITPLSNEFVALDAASDVIHSTVALSGGSWMVTAKSVTGLWARAFNGTSPLSGKWSISSSNSATSATSAPLMENGNLIVTWTDRSLLYAQQRDVIGTVVSPPQLLVNDSNTQVSKAYVSAVAPWIVNINWESTSNSRTSVSGAFLSVRHCGDGYRDDGEQCDGGFGCSDTCTCPQGAQWAVVDPAASTIHCRCQEGYVPSDGDCVVATPDTPIAIVVEPPISKEIIISEPPHYVSNSTAPTDPSEQVSESVSLHETKSFGRLFIIMHIVLVLFY